MVSVFDALLGVNSATVPGWLMGVGALVAVVVAVTAAGSGR